jgi:hypothetical protein
MGKSPDSARSESCPAGTMYGLCNRTSLESRKFIANQRFENLTANRDYHQKVAALVLPTVAQPFTNDCITMQQVFKNATRKKRTGRPSPVPDSAYPFGT